MRGIFLVFIVLLIVIYKSTSKIVNKVKQENIYVLGVYSQNNYDKKFASLIKQLCDERNISVIIKLYDDYAELIKKCNSYEIDFVIVPEDFFIDSCLGLNYFKDSVQINNKYIVSLFFNYIYLVSYPFYKDKAKQVKLTNLTELHNFKKVYNRNFVMGTEPLTSNSYINMILIFNLAGFNLISVDNYSPNEDYNYNDNDILYVNYPKEELHKKMLDKSLDAVFVLDIQNSRFVSTLCQTTQTMLINFDLEKTPFDSLFSNYYSKKKLKINQFYSTDLNEYFTADGITPKDKITYYNKTDLLIDHTKPVDADKKLKQLSSNIGEFDTRSIRNVLITNNNVKSDIVYELCDLIIRNNNYLINKLIYNRFTNAEHSLFEPIDIIYIDRNISFHQGSRKLFQELGFITYDKQLLKDNNLDTDDKYNYYWKYSKIGLSRFKFKDIN